MNAQKVVAEIEALPAEAQREVADFVGFLRSRYAATARKSRTNGSSDAFIGMWKNRADLKDSTAAVRNMRDAEWGP